MSHQSTARLRRWSVVLAVALPTVLIGPAQAIAGGAPGTVPTITSPADGSTSSSSPLSVTATSGATQVRFTIGNGATIDTKLVAVVAGTATADLSIFGVQGSATVSAADCLSGACNVTVDSIGVTVDLAPPVITSPTQNKVVGSSVAVKADAPGGALQYYLGASKVGTPVVDPFDKLIPLGGVGEGSHTITVKQCNVAGDICQGATDTVSVIKDTKGPKFTDLGTSQRTVFPAKDNYQDTTNLSARVGEKSLETKVEIRKAGGPLVRTLKLGRVGPGRVSATWNGRKTNGDIVPKGKYFFRFVGTDGHGVVGKSNDKAVYVSDKKLVKKHVTKTVSAWGSKVKAYAGDCSSVVRVGSGAVGLRSNSKRDCTGDASLAATLHAIKIGKAQKYGNLKVSIYGGGVTKDAPTAILFNVRSDGSAGAKTRLGGALRWTSGDSVSLKQYIVGGKVYWWILTGGGNSYDARKFKISYTVTVLQ